MDIRTLTLDEAWEIFKTDIERNNIIYKKVRFGISIAFDINLYFKGFIIIKGKSGKVFIGNQTYTAIELFTELERRERIMKKWLLENFGEQEIARSWTEQDKGIIAHIPAKQIEAEETQNGIN